MTCIGCVYAIVLQGINNADYNFKIKIQDGRCWPCWISRYNKTSLKNEIYDLKLYKLHVLHIYMGHLFPKYR